MTDTPQHIKDLQRQLWFKKTPEQRLLQFILENDAWWKAIAEAKMNLQKKAAHDVNGSNMLTTIS